MPTIKAEEEHMDYQGNVLGATNVATGVAILPNTGGMPILTIIGIAAIVTGVMLIALQVGVAIYGRK